MPQSNDPNEMLGVMKKNAELLHQNNKLLKKLYRQNIIALGIRVLMYAILIGLPFALYFYIFEPYFNAFGANYELFMDGIGELPGLKGLQQILP